MNKNKEKLKSGEPLTNQGNAKATNLTTTDQPPNISRPDNKSASIETPNPQETIAPHRRFQVKDKNSNHHSFFHSQEAKMDASRPDLDPPDSQGASRPIESESSSVQIITEKKPSCWSVTSPPTAPPTEWNSTGANIDRPASTGLPMYRMPKPEHNVERKTGIDRSPRLAAPVEDKVPAAARVASRKNGHAPESLHHQFQQLQQDARLDAKQASQVEAIQEEVLGRTTQAPPRVQLKGDQSEDCFPVQDPSQAKVHSVHETSITLPAVSSLATISHQSIPSVKQKGAIPPHLKVQSLTSGADKEHDPIPPHLRHLASPSIVTTTKATSLDEDLPPVQRASSTTPDDKLLPHLRALSTTKTLAAEKPVSVTTPMPTSQEKDEGYRPMMNIDAEIAVSQRILDEEVIAGLRAETSGAIPAALLSNSTTQQTNEHVVFVPHNTRASSSKLQPSAVESKPKVVNNSRSQFDCDGDRNQSTNISPNGHPVGSSADALQDVISKRRNANLVSPSKNGDVPNNAISSIKKGKKRAKEFEPVVLTSELADWDGKIIQPPVGDEWDRRTPFDPRSDERHSVIEAWREEHAAEPEEKNRLTINTASLDFQNGEGLAGGYVNVLSPIDKMQHETHAPNDDFTQARRHQNAAEAIKDYEAKIAAKPKRISSGIESMTKQEKRDLRRALIEEDRTRVDPPNPHAPAANIYIRPAEWRDMDQVKGIYNHYVRKASFVQHLEPVDELYWRNRLQEAENERNPFVVAIHLGEKFYRRQEDIIRKKQENVVGFAVAADFGSKQSLFHSTVELELMVNSKLHRQGIGRSLLDRLLGALSPDHHVLECAPFLPNTDICYWIGGGSRQAKGIMVNILYSKDNEDSVTWRKQWLAKYEFQHVGTLPDVGVKAGKLQVTPMQSLKEHKFANFLPG